MSHALKPVPSLSEAWLLALEQTVNSPGGRIAHLMTTITQPGAEVQRIRRGIGRELKRTGEQSVETVSETIFPQSLYLDPGINWSPVLPTALSQKIDKAASHLYDSYGMILPLLRTEHANRMGTYFSRMISWPGREPKGINQLARVIGRIRDARHQGNATENTIDVDLAADCLSDETILEGTQLLAADDKRTRGFPCLVHLDFSLLGGQLHCAAIYRHHYLITKAYGNLLGLSRLMKFVCQQSGCEMGELVILAGIADCQGIRRSRQLARRMRDDLNGATLEIES